MKKFFFDCGTRDFTASTGLAVLRVLTGLMLLIGHGIPKIQSYSKIKDFFYVPEFLPVSWAPASLIACICAEVIASILIILGLMARPAAFVIGFCMVTAAFGKMGAAPWFQTSSTLTDSKELAVLYLIPMISIILAGPGAFSMDASILKERNRRRW